MALSADSLLAFVRDELGIDTSDIDATSELFSEGVIDSLGVLDLVAFVSTEAGIKVLPTEISLENFDTIERILAFASAKAGSR